MATRRLQEVTNDPTSPVLSIDDATGVVSSGASAINSPGSSAPTAAANEVVAGPTSGDPATAAPRALVSGDLPTDAVLAGSPTTTTQSADVNFERSFSTEYRVEQRRDHRSRRAQ